MARATIPSCSGPSTIFGKIVTTSIFNPPGVAPAVSPRRSLTLTRVVEFEAPSLTLAWLVHFDQSVRRIDDDRFRRRIDADANPFDHRNQHFAALAVDDEA